MFEQMGFYLFNIIKYAHDIIKINANSTVSGIITLQKSKNFELISVTAS